MDCIDDRDDSIRVRALELIMGMANKKNIVEIVKKLMSHIDITESTCEITLCYLYINLYHVHVHVHVNTLNKNHYNYSAITVTVFISSTTVTV